MIIMGDEWEVYLPCKMLKQGALDIKKRNLMDLYSWWSLFFENSLNLECLGGLGVEDQRILLY